MNKEEEIISSRDCADFINPSKTIEGLDDGTFRSIRADIKNMIEIGLSKTEILHRLSSYGYNDLMSEFAYEAISKK